jgi:hypothetical protein
MRAPVAVIIFNRPEATKQVLAELAKVEPRRLFVIADGPREDHPEDRDRCMAARALFETVPWECDVMRCYADVNLGCGRRPATGVSWVFDQVEEAVILEDDCVPHPTFFRFCDELLAKYRDDERIMHIAGNNFQFGQTRGPFSYFFSRFNLAWGWASWRRAWRHFDLKLSMWPLLRDTGWLLDVVGDPEAARVWQREFDRAHAQHGDVDYWDHQWTFACWAHNGLSILPTSTLITNIGFGTDATHTRSSRDRRAFLSTEEMRFPMSHPPYVARSVEADRLIVEKLVLEDIVAFEARMRAANQRSWRRDLGRIVRRLARPVKRWR